MILTLKFSSSAASLVMCVDQLRAFRLLPGALWRRRCPPLRVVRRFARVDELRVAVDDDGVDELCRTVFIRSLGKSEATVFASSTMVLAC